MGVQCALKNYKCVFVAALPRPFLSFVSHGVEVSGGGVRGGAQRYNIIYEDFDDILFFNFGVVDMEEWMIVR